MALTFDELTPREREVLALMAEGKTNGDISRELGISFPTAKTHVSSILGKLGANSRDDAVRRWASEAQGSRWTRFGFVPVLMVGMAAVVAVAAVVVVRTLFVAGQSDGRPSEIRIPLDHLAVGTPLHVDAPGLGTSPYGADLGLLLVRFENGTVRAFLDRDPHTGCDVPWNPDYDLAQLVGDASVPKGAFKANCGGWVFLLTGERVFGASPRGLDEFPVEVVGSVAVVNLRWLQLGLCAAPEALPDCSTRDSPKLVQVIPPPIIPDYGHRTPNAATQVIVP